MNELIKKNFESKAEPGSYLLRKVDQNDEWFVVSDCADGELVAVKRLDGSVKYFKEFENE